MPVTHAHFDMKLVKELSNYVDATDMKHADKFVGVEAAYEE